MHDYIAFFIVQIAVLCQEADMKAVLMDKPYTAASKDELTNRSHGYLVKDGTDVRKASLL